MQQQPPYVPSPSNTGSQYGGNSEHVRSIGLDIVLTLLTCYLFNLYIQYRQMLAVNDMLKQERYNFVLWLVLTIITCGLYHLYHEYRKSKDIAEVMQNPNSLEPILSVVLAAFGLGIITDAIQQTEINKFYGNSAL